MRGLSRSHGGAGRTRQFSSVSSRTVRPLRSRTSPYKPAVHEELVATIRCDIDGGVRCLPLQRKNFPTVQVEVLRDWLTLTPNPLRDPLLPLFLREPWRTHSGLGGFFPHQRPQYPAGCA